MRARARGGGVDPLTLLEAMADPHLFAPAFRDSESWWSWRVVLKALFGLPLDEERELELYRRCTGREDVPSERCREAWLVCGRRSGKSFILALLAVWLGCFTNWKPLLARGEQAAIVVIAADRRQSNVVLGYVRGLLEGSPLLRDLIAKDRQGLFQDPGVELTTGAKISIYSPDFRRVRGLTVAAALLDEQAFWPTDESANPDFEVLKAIRPAMLTLRDRGALLVGASSPYARKGELYNAYRRHWGKAGDSVLCWRAPTLVMNPSVPEAEIALERERDPESASSEYDAEFRSDISDYVQRSAVEAVVARGVYERPRRQWVRYEGFVDPSGGSQDSMTLAVGHREVESGKVVLDCLREWRPPFSPQEAVQECAKDCLRYGISTVSGDAYAGEWPREAFRKWGVTYKVSPLVKSEIYREFLPMVNSRQVELLDHPKLVNQLCSLERRTARGGRDSIDHPARGHDDLCNATAGALVGLRAGQELRMVRVVGL
jgi:hypothetical protein